LIGSVWERREPADDAYDRVTIVGVIEGGELVDLVIAPTEFGENASVDPEEFAAAYCRLRDNSTDRLAALDSRLNALAGS
jgi:hypothetical protein